MLDGLEGASTAAGAKFDRASMERTLSGLGNRVFLMNNVHEDQPVIFQSRWALSYLRGPLTREQISRLMADRKVSAVGNALRGVPAGDLTPTHSAGAPVRATVADRPVLPPDVIERFAPRRDNLPPGASVLYRPTLVGQAKLHFTQTAGGVDVWQDVALQLPVDDAVPAETWAKAEPLDPPELEQQPEAGAKFAALPGELTRPKRYAELTTALKDHLYRNRKLQLWKCPALKETSQPDESEAEFRVRLSQAGREQRDAQVEKLRQKYAPKIAAIQERIRKAEVKVEKEKSQANQQSMSAMLSIGTSILGAMFGRKLASSANVNRAATSVRAAGRIARERQDISDAAEGAGALKEQLAALEADFRAETEKIQSGLAADGLALEEVVIQPKKSEISIGSVALVWTPTVVSPGG